MAISSEDAQREEFERRRRLGYLRAKAARDGAEASPALLIEIREIAAALGETTEALPGTPYQDDAMPTDPVTRNEFQMLATQVSRITLVLVLSSLALLLSLASFILVIIVLLKP